MTVRGATLAAVVAAVLVGAVPAVPAAADPDQAAPDLPAAPAAPAPGTPAPAEASAVPVAATDPGGPPPDDGTVGPPPDDGKVGPPPDDGKVGPPPDDCKVVSSPPATTTSPDGWILKLSAKDEVQRPIAPLTTAISTREYEVGGVFNGEVTGGETTPAGVFEVGYQIGCGIDMSTSNGVSLTGTAGVNPSIGYFGFDFPGIMPDGLVPAIGANVSGAVTVGLKPGIINTVPVTKKKYEAAKPWVSITGFRIKIDGCVGESFIRSYAILTKSDKAGDAILSWYGATKSV